jgi:hypothetical protein
MKTQTTDWEKIFPEHHLIKDLYPKYAKDPKTRRKEKKKTSKKRKNPI